MRKIKEYCNYSYKARVIAFIIDLILFPILKLFYQKNNNIKIETKEIKKILLIRLDHIGDYLMLTPGIRNLKKNLPDVEIHFLCSPNTKILAQNNKYIDKIYSISLKWYDGTRNFTIPIKKYFSLIKLIRKENFDICIDFRSDIRSLFFFTLFSKAKIKIGFSHLGGEDILSHKIKYSPDMHWINLNLKLLEILNIKPDNYDYDIFIDRKSEESAMNKLKENDILDLEKKIILHLGGIKHWELKKLPISQWHKVVEIIKKYTEIPLILTGDENDKEFINKFLETENNNFINISGKLNLNEFCYLIKVSDLILSNDTSAMHISSAFKKFTIAFFGPTFSKKSGAIYNPNILIIEKEIDCKKPCYKKECKKNHKCFQLDNNDFIKIENFIKNIL